MMVILVAGMGLIPKEYYEAAEVFGAGPLEALRQGHAADAAASLQTALILRIILAFEVFAVVVALGGTNLPVLMGETYQLAVRAAGPRRRRRLRLVILAISIAFTLVFLRAAARAEGGADMTDAAADSAVAAAARRGAQRRPLAASSPASSCSAPGCWCRSTCSLVNALSSPDEVTGLPEARLVPSFDFGIALASSSNFAGRRRGALELGPGRGR